MVTKTNAGVAPRLNSATNPPASALAPTKPARSHNPLATASHCDPNRALKPDSRYARNTSMSHPSVFSEPSNLEGPMRQCQSRVWMSGITIADEQAINEAGPCVAPDDNKEELWG